MAKNRILYLIPHLENKGPVIQLYLLITNLDDSIEPIVVTFFEERADSMIDDFLLHGVKIVQLKTKRWQLLLQKKKLAKAIGKYKPDIIHSNSVLTDGVCAEINTPIPIILTLHNYIYEDLILQYGKIIGKILCNREEKAIKKANIVITCSKTLRLLYKNVIKRDYVAIQNGIDISKWLDEKYDKKQLRKKLKLPIEGHLYLSTGLLITRKDPTIVIKAFLQADKDNSYLVMLGDGTDEELCHKISNFSSNIYFTGRVNNVKEYLYASDTFISAAHSEGLPYAVIEAECTGIRMILSNIPQHQEAVNNNLDVRFFEIGDQERLTTLIREAYDHCDKINYDLSSFAADSMAKKYNEKYEYILG